MYEFFRVKFGFRVLVMYTPIPKPKNYSHSLCDKLYILWDNFTTNVNFCKKILICVKVMANFTYFETILLQTLIFVKNINLCESYGKLYILWDNFEPNNIFYKTLSICGEVAPNFKTILQQPLFFY